MRDGKGRRTKGPDITFAIELPLYDSMDAMTAQTGIPRAVLQAAKKNGCGFIRHGRPDLGVFLRWWFGRDHETGEAEEDWANRNKRAQALMSEIDLEEKREHVIDFEVSAKFVRRLTSVLFFGELDRLKHEFPATLKGATELKIAEEVERQIELIKAVIKRDAERYATTKGKAAK
jgi:hypothetical protein